MPSDKVDDIIKETVNNLTDIGYFPVAVAMDQESSHRGFVSNFAKVDHFKDSYDPLIFYLTFKEWKLLSQFDENLVSLKAKTNDSQEEKKMKRQFLNKIKNKRAGMKKASKSTFEVKLKDGTSVEIHPMFDNPHLIQSLRNNL